ncbi:uncharacterized protein LOC113290786 [Papaver somniferum]|uniref:uncharacterized protein LOC113290786 n=1 Tax=Papaver somniferum TaxID=3469 RepID=UPI000E6F6E41|nr:uncharacterized protein LOC113290786 [Papaver somniferum]
MESINVVIDDTNDFRQDNHIAAELPPSESVNKEKQIAEEPTIIPTIYDIDDKDDNGSIVEQPNDTESESHKPAKWVHQRHSTDDIIRDANARVMTRREIQSNGKNIFVAQIYVHDIIYGSTSKILTDEFLNLMSGEFEMSNVGELSYFLGLQIQQQKDNIFLPQEKCARNLVEKFELRGTTPMETPMPTTGKLQSNPSEKSVDQKLYRSMIGSPLYLTATRPDISFSVGCCAKFQTNPKESHLKAVKRIIRYVNGTLDYGVSYSMDTNNNLVA